MSDKIRLDQEQIDAILLAVNENGAMPEQAPPDEALPDDEKKKPDEPETSDLGGLGSWFWCLPLAVPGTVAILVSAAALGAGAAAGAGIEDEPGESKVRGNFDPVNSFSSDPVGIQVADQDSGDQPLTTEINVGNGVLNIQGPAQIAGNGTGSITLTGTLEEINATLQALQYTPDPTFSGNDTFSIRTTDAEGGVDVDEFIIFIPNVPATIGGDLQGAITDGDTSTSGVLTALDPDNTDNRFLASEQQGQFGSFSISETGAWEYVLGGEAQSVAAFATAEAPDEVRILRAEGDNAEVKALGEGETVTDVFTVQSEDGTTANITIVITGVNDNPVAVDDAVTTDEDAAVTIAVLDNDSDVDGDAITVSGATDPGNGSVVVNADSTITYTPNADFTGSDSFDYSVEDGNGGSATATVSVTVTAVNDAPVAVDDTAETLEATTVTIAVLDNDTDVDGDTLRVNSAGAASNGTVVINGDGTLAYTPDAEFTGTDSFDYEVVDDQGGSDTGTVTITVRAENADPVAVNDTASTDEDTPVTISILDNDTDADGDSLTINSVGTASHGTVQIAGSSVIYSPDANFNGSDSFSYTVSDGMGGISTAVVSVLVNAVNDDPVVLDDTASTDEDNSVAIAVLDNDSDVDGDALSILSATDGAHGSVSIDGDNLVYVPETDFFGSDVFTYTVSDGQGGSATASVTVTVNPVNDAPVALADTAVTDEDTPVVVPVVANDSDADGDELSVTEVSSATNGTVTNNGDGTVTYTPNPDFNGSDTFSYTVSDGNGGEDTATVTVTVNPVNDAPVAIADTAVTDEDVPVVVPVVANDSDADGDALSVIAVTDASNGTVSNNGDGTVTYTPDPGFNGSDEFSYTVSDGNGGQDTATVTVTVNPVNDAPVAVADTAVTDEDVPVVVPVLANDSDPDGDTLTITAINNALNGTASDNGDGTVTFTPTPGFNGTGEFTYTVSDGNGGEDTATVTITVNPVNDAPVALDDTAATNDNTSIAIAVLSNDSDPDGDVLLVTAVTDGANGTVSNNGDGTVTYTPDPGSSGSDTFSYTISDGNGGVDTATVMVNVTFVNDAPIAVNDAAVTNEDTQVVIPVTANDTDADRDNLTITSVSDPTNGTVSFNSAGNITYRPDPGFSGSDSFNYTISDGNGASDTATVSVTVNFVNDPPIALDDRPRTAEDTPVSFNVLGNDLDEEGDTLQLVSVTSPSNGTITAFNPNGTLTYTPDPEFSGTDTFNYVVRDGAGGTDTGTVIVTVTEVNDAPVAAFSASPLYQSSSVPGPDIAIADVDGGPGPFTADIFAGRGSFNMSAYAGPLIYTLVSDAFGSYLYLEGSLSDINDALAALQYSSPVGYVGDDTIDISLSDGTAESFYSFSTTLIERLPTQQLLIPADAGGNEAQGLPVSSLGDVDGDGLADFIVGAPKVGGVGAVYTVTGDEFYDATIPGNSEFLGAAPYFLPATSFISEGIDDAMVIIHGGGDVDGDGVADFVYSRNLQVVDLGGSFVAADFRLITNWDNAYDGDAGTSEETTGFLSIEENINSLDLSGDFNGDGLSDIAIGATDFTTEEGTVFLYFGNPGIAGPGYFFESDTFVAGEGLEIVKSDESFAFDAANAGDIDGDGFDDIIIGSPGYFYDYAGTFDSQGAAYVVFGNSNLGVNDSQTVVDLDDVGGAGIDAPGDEVFTFLGASSDATGFSVAGAGDVNGDGVDDIIIGAPEFSPPFDGPELFVGAAYVVFGNEGLTGSTLSATSLDGSNGFAIRSSSASLGTYTGPELRIGEEVAAAGDINGDGYGDVIISSAGDGATQGPSAFVVFGGPTSVFASGLFDLDSLPTYSDALSFAGIGGFRVDFSYGGEDAFRGSGISSAGDVNGDGFDDLLLGSPESLGYDGELKLIFGQSSDPTGAILGTQDSNDLDASALSPGDDVVVAGDGDDKINAGGGSDVIYAGAGNDSIDYDALDRLIDGGYGFDRLVLDGGETLLLTPSGDIRGIEWIDAEQDSGSNTIFFSGPDDPIVINMTDDKIADDISSLLGLPDNVNALIISGGTEDAIELFTSFVDTGDITLFGQDYDIYTSFAAGSNAVVYIDRDIDILFGA